MPSTSRESGATPSTRRTPWTASSTAWTGAPWKQYIACHAGFKVLKLPYERMNESNWDWKLCNSLPKFCMCIFLPDDREGLQSMVEEIASSPKFLHHHLPLECVPVGQFRLPKFKLSFERITVAGDLKHLGLHLPFDEAEANMSDMHAT